MSGSLVIIGGGHAGVALADEARGRGWNGPITVIEADQPFPYQRPPLSKDFLSGAGEAVPLRGSSFFENRDIRLILGHRASAVDRRTAQVVLDDGERIGYDVLVLAVGGRHRELKLPGTDLDGVRRLRTLQEAHDLSASLATSSKVVIIGAGFIGLEAAFSARERGLEVEIFGIAPVPLSRVASAELSAFAAQRMSDARIVYNAGTGIEEIIGDDGRAVGVRAGGAFIPADLVLVGIGIVPNDEIAADAGLAVADGIQVDAFLRTSDPAIWAIGDCARHPNEFAGASVRIESVQNATDQARYVARALTGGTAVEGAYREVPWFWSHLGHDILNIAGIASETTRTVVVGDEPGRRFSILRWDGDELVCVESVNARADHLAARWMLASGYSPAPEEAERPDFDLRRIAAQLAPASTAR